MQLGTSGNPGAVSLPVEFYAKQLIERRRKRNKNANTTNTYESHLRNHILPFAGRRPASALRRRDSTALVDWLLVKPSLSSTCTVVQIFKTWRILVHYMLDEDVPLPSNVVARIDLPDVTQRVAVALSPGQVAAIAAAMRKVAPRYEILIWLAACAGLRQGEAFGLRQSQVMQSQDRLCIKEQRQRGKAVGLKTKASYATLPVDHFLIEQLTQHSSQFVEPELVSPYTEQRRRARGYAEPPGEDLIVTNRFGRPVLRSDFHDKWKRAVRLAGLPGTTRFHDLKHFYTTTLGSSGNHDPKTVQALSRHAEFSETWDTYAHPPLAVEHVTVTAFSSAFAHIAQHSSCHEQP
ncbi:tyrosine-type recombinase/integrase [Streptomyces sp. WI04-05B]|uniref:tyrosine-type recombinase/integrase n=1 Tax=Streptomyces TaxID=1883 RepID=UPI00099C9CF8|nr:MULTISPECIES: site-specific integrase [unclassified Streptomyces]MDX2540640.1 site-specific integrase [Streptomyces sp. WI04-05B]MDX2584928.1 site-specific integrase [Streptomyces sp. WI04-05A]